LYEDDWNLMRAIATFVATESKEVVKPMSSGAVGDAVSEFGDGNFFMLHIFLILPFTPLVHHTWY